MTKNKKKHHAPVSHLKAFANPDEYVWKMDRWTGEIEREGRRGVLDSGSTFT